MKQNAIATPTSLPAPVGGWNARDSLGAMPASDAVILTNFVPNPTSCDQRNGYINWVTGLPGQVSTTMGYAGTSTNKLLAAAGGAIYDVTNTGVVGAPLQSGLGSDKWQHVIFANTGGNYLYMVNGVDAPRYYDGTTFTPAAITGPADITKLININVNHNRVWFAEAGTMTAWYLATNAIAGAATPFYLSGVARWGGFLQAIGTWTIDSGQGMNDNVVFLTSEGEAIIYTGTDPSDATAWSLVGVFEFGTPIGRRCFTKYQGDLVVITRDGLVPMAQGLQSSRLDPRVNLTDKIQFATSQAINLYGANFGWEAIAYPSQNLLMLNVPVAVGQQQQFVMNTINGSWCNFTGWNANSWELFNDELYFGSDGLVCKAWSGLSDNGNNIQTEGLQAFNYFGASGILKRFTMMRPVLRTTGVPAVLGQINVDFNTANTSAPLSFSGSGASLWDAPPSTWDTATFGGDLAVSQQWQGANGVGYCGAPHLLTAASGLLVQWVSTDIVMERGGIL